jgi:hypothetical protein
MARIHPNALGKCLLRDSLRLQIIEERVERCRLELGLEIRKRVHLFMKGFEPLTYGLEVIVHELPNLLKR